MVENSGTATGAGRFRPLNEPAPVAVEAGKGGQPAAVLWRGAYRRVGAIHDTWRIDDEWWREEIARRYFAIQLDDGRRMTVYHDLVRDAWYHQPYQDGREAKRAG